MIEVFAIVFRDNSLELVTSKLFVNREAATKAKDAMKSYRGLETRDLDVLPMDIDSRS